MRGLLNNDDNEIKRSKRRRDSICKPTNGIRNDKDDQKW